MISRIVIASMLAATSVSGSGQAVAPRADGTANAVSHMHQCTLNAVSGFAINTKGTGTSAGRMSGSSPSVSWSRIDLHLAGSPDGSGGPVISAHAINTKGTGANTGRSNMAINTKGTGTSSGRMSSDHAINTKGTGTSAGRSEFAINTKGTGTSSGRTGVTNQNPIGVDCVTSQVIGDDAAQKATMSSFNFMRTDGTAVGWSCSVSGSEDKPVFRIELLVPTILGQAESAPGKVASWSWGVSNSGTAIVKRSAGQGADSGQVACASKEPRIIQYDLALMKKV